MASPLRLAFMTTPYVSCIMPTANRPQFVPFAIDYFLKQDFKDAELIIIDDGKESVSPLLYKHKRIKYYYSSPIGTIGAKRNYACNKATGKIIMHWDDDDWYAQDWISRQVRAIENSHADICGLNEIYFFSPLVNKYWKHSNKSIERPWICGATMIYLRSFWQQHPFKNIHIGEDWDYVWNNNAILHAHEYIDGFFAILHAGNTTLKPFENPNHKRDANLWMDVAFENKKK